MYILHTYNFYLLITNIRRIKLILHWGFGTKHVKPKDELKT